MSKHLLSACIVIVGLLGTGIGLAQVVARPDKDLVEVTVTGQGEDKDEAVRDALRKAVEKGSGAFVYSQSEVKDFALLRDTIMVRAAGFVQSYKVLSAVEAIDGTWLVKIKAVVTVKGIKDAWATVTTMLKQVGHPKLMVFINEKIGASTVADSTVQTRIENLLLKSGFHLVNREQLKEIDRKDLAAAVAEDNPAKLQAVAKRFGAQLFISGSANATAGVRKIVAGIRLHTYQAEANVRCYRSDTGQLLSSIPGTSTRGVDRVWRSAAKKSLDLQGRQIAPMVRDDILRFWRDALSGRGEVQFHVQGLSFKQYVALKKALLEIKQVKEASGRFHNGVAEFSIQSDVGAEKLAEKIIEVIENVEITDVSKNVVKGELKKSTNYTN